jgi:hypothetical protein
MGITLIFIFLFTPGGGGRRAVPRDSLIHFIELPIHFPGSPIHFSVSIQRIGFLKS